MKPMLATNITNLEAITYPVIISAKLDGYRAVCKDGSLLSRNLKPIRNTHIRTTVERYADVLNGFDGELCLADLTASFNLVSSAVSSEAGNPDFRYVIFDNISDGNYQSRFLDKLGVNFPEFVVIVPMKEVNSLEEITEQHAHWISQGFEGTMVRRFDGSDRYKYGRSTEKELFLCKIKDFEDFEAEIIGFEERMHNGNEATTDLLGHTERSSHKANMIPMNTLGALVVKSELYSEPFRVGTGFDDEQRRWIWDNRDTFLGMLAKIKHQPSGSLEGGLPRFPVFISIRDRDDISE